MAREQIRVGTCIPGRFFSAWGPAMVNQGFECFAINFHMRLGDIDPAAFAKQVRQVVDGTDVKISALGFYCNALQNEEHRETLHKMIDLAGDYGTGIVSTFAGALEGEPVDAAMPRFKEVFGEVVRHAEDKGVRIALENCPMKGTWSSPTCNIAFNPRAWDMIFDAIPSDSLGLEWEPTHQMVQLIDPIANLRKYVGKVFHVHGKDARVRYDVIASEGIMGPTKAVETRAPGLGDTDWRKVFEILEEAGYEGMVSIEGDHDSLFKKEWEYTGQLHSLNYLKWCRGGSFTPNPWDL